MSSEQQHKNPLDRPADLASLQRLFEKDLLSRAAYLAARQELIATRPFRDWARKQLLFFGTTLLLAGVIFFFAYNWANMGRFLKLGLAASSILACAYGAHAVGREKLLGKSLVLSASVLTGVLLAVFGQIYQAGADAYELFVGWAALIFVWVLITDFAALWMLWIVIVHCGAIFYWVQVLEPGESMGFDSFVALLAGMNAVLLALREMFLRRGQRWLAGQWLRDVLVLAFLVALTIPILGWIFDIREATNLGVLALFLWIGAAAGCFFAYRYYCPDIHALTFLVLQVSVVVCCFVIQGIYRLFDRQGGVQMLFFYGIAVLAIVGGAAWTLKQLIRQMSETESASIAPEQNS